MVKKILLVVIGCFLINVVYGKEGDPVSVPYNTWNTLRLIERDIKGETISVEETHWFINNELRNYIIGLRDQIARDDTQIQEKDTQIQAKDTELAQQKEEIEELTEQKNRYRFVVVTLGITLVALLLTFWFVLRSWQKNSESRDFLTTNKADNDQPVNF